MPGQSSAGGIDAFVRKYDASGAEVWTRQFGSDSYDTAWGISADSTGIYVSGYTCGSLPGQTSAGGYDTFVAKLNPGPKLFVCIPGINDNGDIMLGGASNIVRGDPECTVIIREKDNFNMLPIWVKQEVTEKAIKAKSKGKDVIVLIDMDLENYTWEYLSPREKNPWFPSVAWAGRMANVVSKAFKKEVPGGVRILLAHSAGGYATYESIQREKEKMFDDINILNGRVSAKDLSSVLKSRNYGWQQVKVFTSENDLPALPPIERVGSISNYDAAKKYAGTIGGWVHLHSLTITGHSGLRDSLVLQNEGTFDVNRGIFSGCNGVVGKVKEMMSWDWSTGCFVR